MTKECSRGTTSLRCSGRTREISERWGELITRAAMYDNLNRFIVPNVAGPARLVPLTALVAEDVTLAALRHAAQRGRLDAVQGADGIWRSSRKAVDAYRRSKHRRQGVGRAS